MSAGFEGSNILIVDDDKAIRGFLRGRLESQRWLVHEASDGAKALDVLRQEPIDLIITDLKMPSMNGHELMEELHDANDPRPVIVLTGHGEKADAVEALRRGAVDFIDKPFQFDTLRVAIQGALHDAKVAAGELPGRQGRPLRSAQEVRESSAPKAAPAPPAPGAGPQAGVQTGGHAIPQTGRHAIPQTGPQAVPPTGPHALPDSGPYPTGPAATDGSAKAQSLIGAIRERLAQGSVNLPVMGPVVQDLKGLMDDPNHEISQVAQVIETDQEIVGRIIAMANSGAYGGRSTATNVQDAVSRMGMRAVFAAAVQCVTSRMKEGIEDPRLEQVGELLFMRTIDTAKAGRALARQAKDRQPDDVYTLALLADVGELFLLRVIDQVLPNLEDRPNTETVRREVERYHAEFGAAMLTRWGFDGDPVAAAKAHHDAKRVAAISTTNPLLGRRLRFLALARYAVGEVTGIEAGERSCLGPFNRVLADAELSRDVYDAAVAQLDADKARDAGEEIEDEVAA